MSVKEILQGEPFPYKRATLTEEMDMHSMHLMRFYKELRLSLFMNKILWLPSCDKRCQWQAVSGNLVVSHWISGLLSRQNEASQPWWWIHEENMNQEDVCVCWRPFVRSVFLLLFKNKALQYTLSHEALPEEVTVLSLFAM